VNSFAEQVFCFVNVKGRVQEMDAASYVSVRDAPARALL